MKFLSICDIIISKLVKVSCTLKLKGGGLRMEIAMVKELPLITVFVGRFLSNSNISYAINALLSNERWSIGARLEGAYGSGYFAFRDEAVHDEIEINKVNCEGVEHVDDENVVIYILCNLRCSASISTSYNRRGRLLYNKKINEGRIEISLIR